MPGQHLYEYAAIRIVPRVEREEFVNVGVIVFCKRQNFIHVRYKIDEKRLRAFCAGCDIDELNANLEAFVNIGHGLPEGGPMAKEDAPSRFRWLTAMRSAVIQTSRPHQGFSDNLDATSEKLFAELVECPSER